MRKYDISILIVDDDTYSLGLQVELLDPWVNKVYVADDAQQGIEQFELHKPDLIITDISMPVMNGLDMIKQIKSKHDVKTIVYTAYTQNNLLLKAIDLGVEGFIVKPIDTKRFYAIFHKVASSLVLEKDMKRATQSLKEKEFLTRLLYNNVDSGIYIFNEEFKLAECNETAYKWLGYSKEELFKKDIQHLEIQKYAGTIHKKLKGLINGQKISFESAFQAKNGKIVHCELHAKRIVFNKKTMYYVTSHNITKKIHAEESIKRQKNFYKTILNSLTYPLTVIDIQTHMIIEVNKAASLLGLSTGMSAGFSFFHNMDENCREYDHNCPLKIFEHSSEPVIVDKVFRDNTGKVKQYEIHGYPVFDNTGNLAQIIEYAVDKCYKEDTTSHSRVKREYA